MFARYPVNLEAPDKDDAFIAGEVVRLSMRGKVLVYEALIC